MIRGIGYRCRKTHLKDTTTTSFGEERYEKEEMQQRVRTVFDSLKLLDDTPWHVVDASQSIEQVHNEIWALADATRLQVQQEPIRKLWESGEYDI